MEEWVELVHQYPSTKDLKTFNNTLKRAQHMLKEDLAPFEADWFITTLLYEPVNLLITILSQRTVDTWKKILEDAFKILTDIVIKFENTIEKHYEDFAQLCMLNYSAKISNQALICLTEVTRRSVVGASDAKRFIDELLQSRNSKTPLCLLVGTICEYHPEVVEDSIETILRTFLSSNVLNCDRNSDLVMCSALQGLAGLLKNFGDRLPTSDLLPFYDKLTREFMRKTKCYKVVLQILSAHAKLFAERLAGDAELRLAMWCRLNAADAEPDAVDAVVAALQAIYDAVFQMAGQTVEQVQEIIKEEIIPHLQSRPRSKITALRVLALAKEQYDIPTYADVACDVHELEFEVRRGLVDCDVANHVAWCLESSPENNERLLQTAIMFFTNLPTAKLKQTVVYNLLAAPDDVRKSSVIFLTTESCQDALSLEKFRPLWILIFDCDNAVIEKFMEGVSLVFEDFMEYLVMLFDMFLDECLEVLPEKLCWLLYLCVDVVRAREAVGAAGVTGATEAEWCARALRVVCDAERACGATPATRAAGSALAQRLHAQHRNLQTEFYDLLDVDTCIDEEVLNETCLAFMYAPKGLGRLDTTLDALQITLSSPDKAPDVLNAAVRKLDEVLSNNDVYGRQIDQILYQVEKLRTRKRGNTKHDRILIRDVLMFLGKFGDSGRSGKENLAVGIQEPIVLSVQNPTEYGVSYNINLCEMLQLAEAEEDENALRSILAVVCANKSWCPRVADAGAGAGAGAGAAQALRACAVLARAPAEPVAAFAHVLPYITSECRWRIRKLLADGMASLLTGAGDDALAAVIDRAQFLTNSTFNTDKRAGLDLIESLMVPLKDRNDLSKKLLPNILIDTARAFEINSCSAFNAAVEVFIDKIALLDQCELQKLQNDLIETITSDKIDVVTDDMRIYKLTVKNVLNALMRMDVKKVDCAKMNIKWLYVAAQARKLGVEGVVDSLVAPSDIPQALRLTVDDDDWFQVEAFFIFLEVFADVLLEHKADEVIQVIADVILHLDSETINLIQRSLKSCVKVYSKRSNEQQLFNLNVNAFRAEAPLEQITIDLEKNFFNPEYSSQLEALNVITDLGCCLDETDKTFISQWPRFLFQMWTRQIYYPSGLLEVAMRSLTRAEVKNLILNGQGITPDSFEIIQFCRANMCVFFEYLVRKPFLLCESDVAECGVLLNDVVQWFVRRKCPQEWCDDVLDLVDQAWAVYEGQVSFELQVSLLRHMRRAPAALAPHSAPMRWAVERMQRGDVGEMISLVAVLPPGDAYKESFRKLATFLPTRLKELSGESNAVFRAMVDAAADGDHTLLKIIAMLASDEESVGWWDEAMDCCMASLAQRGDRDVCRLLHELAWAADTLGVCDRLYLPLLRYSSSQFLEEYLPEEVVNALKFPEQPLRPASVFAYREQVKHYAIVFSIIQLAMEKLSTPTLELSTSSLNSRLGEPRPWHVVREVLIKSVNYMKQPSCPDGADKPLQNICRQAQCAAFACAGAALRRRAPAERAYVELFEPARWPALVDPDTHHDLPLPSKHVVLKTRYTIGSEDAGIAGSAGSAGTTRTLTRSAQRTRLFLRTLSENPLQYDEEPIDDEAPEEQEVEVSASWLNSLRVSRELTALVRHACARSLAAPRRLATALRTRMPDNAKLMLAQVVCNCSAELAPYADALRPALFQLVAEANDEPLNSLHLDILTTLSQWRDDVVLTDSAHLNEALLSLMLAIINNRFRNYTYNVLIGCLNKLLEVYGPMASIQWTIFERYFNHEKEDMQKTCLKMLKTFTKNNVYISGMVQAIIRKLNDEDGLSPDMATLLGMALSVRCDDVTLETITALINKSSQVQFIKTLYYVQMECNRCCTVEQFEKVNNLYASMPASEKKKCLQIMASFLSGPCKLDSDYDVFKRLYLNDYITNTDDDDLITEAIKVVKCSLHLMKEPLKSGLVQLVADHCKHLSATVREAALDVVTKVFQEWQPSASSVVLEAARAVSNGGRSARWSGETSAESSVLRAMGAAGSSLPRRVAPALATHLPTRFAESLYLAVYLPATANQNLDLCEVAAIFLETLFSGMRSHEAFKNIKLRNEPLPNKEPVRALSFASSTRHFTLGTATIQAAADTDVPAVDVQMKVDDILTSLFQFIRMNSVAAVRLVSTVTSACTCAGAGADAGAGGGGAEAAHARVWLGALLDAAPRALSPLVLQLARDFLPHLCALDSFQESVTRLRRELIGTELEDLTNLLYEETLLRTSGPELFVLLSKPEEMDEDFDDFNEHFSIRGLVSCFGKLANWDNLTLQQKRTIERRLPPLWIDKESFQMELEEYDTEGDGWFTKVVSAYRGFDDLLSMRWLRELQHAPTSQFEVSAVTEAIQWQSSGGLPSQYRGKRDLPRNECLAEWAARLMLRACALRRVCGASEVRWCARATQARLAPHSLQCMLRNVPNLSDANMLPWFLQRLHALRLQALEMHDITQLSKLLEQAMPSVAKFPHEEPAELLHLNLIILQLRCDINEISERYVVEALEKIDEQHSRVDEDLCPRSKIYVHDTLQLAMTCYLELWTTKNDVEYHELLLCGMSGIVMRAARESACAGAPLSALLVVLLHRARSCDHQHDADEQILDAVECAEARLAPGCRGAARRWAGGARAALAAGRAHMFRQCLQLLCDPPHTLQAYCRELAQAVLDNDPAQWNKTFTAMNEKFFENPYVGSDFLLLRNYKTTLYEIKEYDATDNNRKLKVLRELDGKLQRPPQKTLRLSQLCAVLGGADVRHDPHLAGLLDLPAGLTVISFDEQVEVMTASVRRPCVVSAALSDGTRRRFLHKRGDRPRLDASLLLVAETLLPPLTTYMVKPLSEDSALIEFLKDHVQLDTLIMESCDLSQMAVPQDDEDLVLRPAASSLLAFQQRCNAVPAHVLRISLEKRSSSLEDFVRKKTMFLETVVSTTLLCWLFGVGDRHTQNVLVGAAGGVACVDWADALRYGAGELPPARLTRTILAVMNRDVLESRLQQQLQKLRDSVSINLEVIKFAFSWMGDKATEKLKYVEGFLTGKYLPHHVTKMALEEQRGKHFEKYIELLDLVFEDYKDREEEQYSVEEQVSCLLRQCTDPRILAVTRSGWQPWL